MNARRDARFWIALAASALVVVGSLIPWIAVSSPVRTELGRGLPDEYWQFALIAGGASFIAVVRARWAPIAAVIALFAVLACLAATMADILEACGSAEGFVGCGDDGFLTIGPSFGWWMTGIAAIIGIGLHGYSALRTSSASTPKPATTPVPHGVEALGPRPPAWHADPTGRFELRYWDGTAWTEHVSSAGAQSVDPVDT